MGKEEEQADEVNLEKMGCHGKSIVPRGFQFWSLLCDMGTPLGIKINLGCGS